MLRVRALTVVFLVIACVPVGTAAAQTRAPESSEYRALIDEGLREYEAHHFEEARGLFGRAAEIQPSARVLRGIGMCEFELRNYGDSVDSLQKALSSNVRPLEGTLRTETEHLLERARSFVARLSVAIEPKAAVVIVDGTPWQLGPNGDLVLEVGDHVLEFRAEGYQTARHRKKVRGGEYEEVRILLSPEAVPARVPPVTEPEAPPRIQLTTAPTPVKDERRPLYKNPWLWTGVAIVAGGVATGVILATRSGGGGHRDAIASSDATGLSLP